MNQKWIVIMGILLAGIAVLLAAGMGLAKQMPAEVPGETEITLEPTEETSLQLPDAMLYYGEIQKIRRDGDGKPEALQMLSPRDGAYVMNLGEKTRYIDSGERKCFDPGILEEGQRYYVFCSPVQARTLPPQSPAFAVVGNIPMDAGCAMYHEAEKMQNRDGTWQITTDHGNLTLELDAASTVLDYAGNQTDLSALQEGGFFMAWYWNQGEEVVHASHIMVLPE